LWQYREPGTQIGVRALVQTEGGSTTLLVEVDNAVKAGAALLSDEECERAFAFGAKEHTASVSSSGIGLDNVSLRTLTRSALPLIRASIPAPWL